jgi:DNA polymerase III subunit epsilon
MTSKPRKRKHNLEWEGKRYRCTMCQWTWKNPPRSACPEVPCYRVDDLPSYLVSEPELHRRHLQAAGPPDACYFRLKEPHWLWLFDVRKATSIELPKLPRFDVVARLKAWWGSKQVWCYWCGWRPESDEDRKHFTSLCCDACRFEKEWLRQRKAVCRWAHTLMQADDWVLLSTATTGLHSWAEVIELAVLRSNGEVLLHTLLRPQPLIDPEATTIHGLTEPEVQAVPAFPDIWPELSRIFKRRYTIIAYDVLFHQRVLAFTAGQYQLRLPSLSWHCLMEQYAHYWGALRDDGSFRWQKLSEACKEQHVPRGRSRMRRALPQAQKSLELLKALAAKAEPSLSQRGYALFGVR